MALEPQNIQLIKDILIQFPQLKDSKVFIYGSRALHDHHHKYSDVDLGIQSNIPLDSKIISDLETAFEESDLPYIVDIVDFNQTEEQFKKVALQKTIPIKIHYD